MAESEMDFSFRVRKLTGRYLWDIPLMELEDLGVHKVMCTRNGVAVCATRMQHVLWMESTFVPDAADAHLFVYDDETNRWYLPLAKRVELVEADEESGPRVSISKIHYSGFVKIENYSPNHLG